MPHRIAVLLAAMAVSAVAFGLQAATQEDVETQKQQMVTPTDLEWKKGPPSLAEGSELAVLEGDPTKEGLFTMRLRLPDGFRISPHTHPKVERVTVIEGTLRLGMGGRFVPGEMKALERGSFFTMPPGMEHFAQAEGETVIQLTGLGPWQINYVNPADDPRRKQ